MLETGVEVGNFVMLLRQGVVGLGVDIGVKPVLCRFSRRVCRFMPGWIKFCAKILSS